MACVGRNFRGIVERAGLDFVTHKGFSARAVARPASTEGAIEEFLCAFIKLFYRKGPCSGFIMPPRTRNIIAGVALCQCASICTVVRDVVSVVEVRRRRARADISEKVRRRGPRAARSSDRGGQRRNPGGEPKRSARATNKGCAAASTGLRSMCADACVCDVPRVRGAGGREDCKIDQIGIIVQRLGAMR